MVISVGGNFLNKKNAFEYTVPPPSRGVGTIKINIQQVDKFSMQSELGDVVKFCLLALTQNMKCNFAINIAQNFFQICKM